MNEQAKENDTMNAQDTMERKVETMDYRSSAGKQGQEERNVKVIHQSHSKSDGGGVGLLASAIATVSSTIQASKDAISKK
ncbi:hypothetical protein TanjilG_07677 [Lupinus angustifolius]|uniref:Uncharacterized protein n=1 Tax=Lupinus angustifolius TaxID=3871 RepID=A0A1J7G0G8_LUPAN|nr:PREDICTED: uncharacterized protein LOC109330636 [Lupinus angustifolius]OIV93774.1 hypothetical protein TanjilG_07677 [Lupinus angustifolius]